MKYAIYDKAADAYLTKMVFDVGYSQHTQFECALTEYITNAELLDTKKAAVDTIARIESFKFMEKGRFVVHQFNDALKDEYIISEAGNPTKVVDNITVDLSGAINVKYGTMPLHWSASSLDYVVNRLNRLQDASAPSIYTNWYNTFNIYKVITVIDERECTHYQFIKVTEKGLDSAKEKVNSLNKCIEELEKLNYELGEENDKLEAKVKSIKKEAHDWKELYKNADADREELKNVIDIIHTDLVSSTACDNLKDTLKAINCNSGLDHISMDNFLTAKDEICYIVDQIITIMESRELNQNVAFSSAEEVDRAKRLANDIIDIWEADDKFEVTLKKFSQLYEAVNDPSDDDGTIMYAFKGILEIFSSLEDHVRGIIDESVSWKHKTMKAEKALDNQKKLNEATVATIVRYRNERRDMDKEIKELRTMRDCLANIIYAIRNAICDNNGVAFDCIESRMRHDSDFNSDPFMAGVRENIKDICAAEKRNLANHGLKNSEIAKAAGELNEWKRKCKAKDTDYEMLQNKLKACEIILESTQSSLTATIKERDKALERAEKFKGIANSVYGMSLPCRCNGKQMFCDITTGKKILVDKEKYDDLVEYVASINLTYDNMFCTMDKPVYLSAITDYIKNLTE